MFASGMVPHQSCAYTYGCEPPGGGCPCWGSGNLGDAGSPFHCCTAPPNKATEPPTRPPARPAPGYWFLTFFQLAAVLLAAVAAVAGGCLKPGALALLAIITTLLLESTKVGAGRWGRAAARQWWAAGWRAVAVGVPCITHHHLSPAA